MSDESFHISGPISFYIYRIPKYKKTVYMFGDAHESWANMCEGTGISLNDKTYYLQNIKKCDIKDNCRFITTLIEEILQRNISKNKGAVTGKKSLVCIMYEENVYPEHKRLELGKRLAVLRENKLNFIQRGPINYLIELYKDCTHLKKGCHEYSTFVAVDFRPNIGLDKLYIKLDKLTTILEGIVITQKLDSRSYNQLVTLLDPSDNPSTLYGSLQEINKIFAVNETTELLPQLVKIFDTILERDGGLILDQIKTCPTEIQTLLLRNYKLSQLFALGNKFKIFIDLLKNLKREDFQKIYESLGYETKTGTDKEEEQLVKIRSYFVSHLETVKVIYDSLVVINKFLVDFSTLFMDLYTLATMFGKAKDKEDINSYIIYAGDSHIQNYRKFFSIPQVDAVQKFASSSKYDAELEDDTNDGFKRCVDVNLSKEKVVNFDV